MVRQRQEIVAPPPFRRVPGLDPQTWRLWRRVAKDCGWQHPKAPAVRKLWREGATGAVLEFLEDTSVGRRLSAGGTRAPRVEKVGEGEMSEG